MRKRCPFSSRLLGRGQWTQCEWLSVYLQPITREVLSTRTACHMTLRLSGSTNPRPQPRLGGLPGRPHSVSVLLSAVPAWYTAVPSHTASAGSVPALLVPLRPVERHAGTLRRRSPRRRSRFCLPQNVHVPARAASTHPAAMSQSPDNHHCHQ